MSAQTSPRGTLYLHVGTHKTGTSSFQRLLDEGRASPDGLPDLTLWRDPGAKSCNAAGLANLMLRKSLVTTPRCKGHFAWTAAPAFQAAIAGVREAIRKRATPDMVVSSEEFCMLRKPAERRRVTALVRGLFDRLIIVLCLRNTEEWRAARTRQLTRSKVLDHMRALPDARSCDGSWYYDTAAICAFWEGFGAVRRVDYDAERDQSGSILPALCTALDRPQMADGACIWLNVSPSASSSPARI